MCLALRLSRADELPMDLAALFCIESRRLGCVSAAPIQTSGQCSMRGRTNPLYTETRPPQSKTCAALRKKPSRRLALSEIARTWPANDSLQSKMTSESLTDSCSGPFVSPKRIGGIPQAAFFVVSVIAWDFVGSKVTLQGDPWLRGNRLTFAEIHNPWQHLSWSSEMRSASCRPHKSPC